MIKKPHKKIGIIGGVGPQATAFIYQKIIEISQTKYKAKDNSDYPYVVIESLPVPDFISDTTNLPIAKKMLVKSVRSLTNAGATRLSIGSNTVHILLDELSKQTNVKFISMIDLVVKKCAQQRINKVGLLGTPVLIKSGIYEYKLNNSNIDMILPTENEIDVADSIIRDVLAGKKVLGRKTEYIATLNSIFNRGAEALILGCTELPLALNYDVLGNRIISSDEVLAEGIVDYYYNDES